MTKMEKVIKGLEWILEDDKFGFGENWHIDSEPKTEEEKAGYNIQRAIELLKEQEGQIKNRDESLEKAREEIKWLRGMLKEKEAIVRCKDCKYAYLTDDGECKYCEMEKDDNGSLIELYRSWDWFCADGERRTDDA